MDTTEILRRMLEERRVEWREHEAPAAECIAFFDGNGWHDCWESVDGEVNVTFSITPEQAIAATLGSGNCSNDCTNSERTGTCHNSSKVMDEHGQARFACSECDAWIDSRMLWNPEYPNGESPWVSGCKLNFCPNCGRRIVDPTTNDVDAEVVTDG